MTEVADIARQFLAEAVRASGLAPYALAMTAAPSATTTRTRFMRAP